MRDSELKSEMAAMRAARKLQKKASEARQRREEDDNDAQRQIPTEAYSNTTRHVIGRKLVPMRTPDAGGNNGETGSSGSRFVAPRVASSTVARGDYIKEEDDTSKIGEYEGDHI